MNPYTRDQSLVIQQEDEEDLEQQSVIVQQEADNNEIIDETNLTFTQMAQTTFNINIPQQEILIALDKFERESLKELCQGLSINLTFQKDHIIIQTEKNGKEAEQLQYQLQQYFSIYKSVQLDFDIESIRSIQISNLLISELSKQKMYLIRIKSLDNQISLFLVSQKKNLQIYANNLERRLRGVRIFFSDCVGYMTRFLKNKDYKDCLTILRQAHYQKTLKQKIENSFGNIIYHDIVDKKHCFSSLILGLNFPYHLQGKRDLCQKIFRYISSSILQWFIVFIQFNGTQENIRQANLLVNITNDAKEKNFLCTSQVFLNVQSVAIIGPPQDLIQIVDSYLVSNKDNFNKTFISSIGVLEKNFCYNAGDTRISYETIERQLKGKQQIELSSIDQFKQIKIKEKFSFISYCNLLRFILEQKYKLSKQTEIRLQEELEYVQGKLIQQDQDQNSNQNFYDSLQIQMDFQEQNPEKSILSTQQMETKSYGNKNNDHQFQQQKENGKKEFKQSSNQNRDNKRNQQNFQKQEFQQNNNRQSQRGDNRNGNHPRNQRIQENQSSGSQSQPYSQKSTEEYNDNKTVEEDDSKQNEQKNEIQLIAEKQPSQIEDQLKVEFEAPIINHMKENKKLAISQQYKEYFTKLINEDINLSMSFEKEKYQSQFPGFICLQQDEMFKLKCFSKKLKIFEKEQNALQYSIKAENTKVIKVLINKNAEKVNALEQEEKQENSYFELTQDNQIYPVKLIELQS